LAGLAIEAQKRETGSIRSEGGSQVGSGGFWLDPGISGIPCVTLNSRVSHFSVNVTFLRNSVEFVFLMRIGIHGGHYSGYREHFLRKLSHFSDSSENGGF